MLIAPALPAWPLEGAPAPDTLVKSVISDVLAAVNYPRLKARGLRIPWLGR